MAINLDRNLLVELGLGTLPEAEQRSLLNHIYETLEMRVGMRLADQMSNEQLDEFERYFEAKDENGAFHWLETNFPNYKEIVQDEFNKLKEEVRKSAPQILQASLTAASSTQPQQTAMPSDYPTQPQMNPGYGQYTAPDSAAPMPQQPFQPQPQYQPPQPPQQPPMPPYQPPAQQPPQPPPQAA